MAGLCAQMLNQWQWHSTGLLGYTFEQCYEWGKIMVVSFFIFVPTYHSFRDGYYFLNGYCTFSQLFFKKESCKYSTNIPLTINSTHHPPQTQLIKIKTNANDPSFLHGPFIWGLCSYFFDCFGSHIAWWHAYRCLPYFPHFFLFHFLFHCLKIYKHKWCKSTSPTKSICKSQANYLKP